MSPTVHLCMYKWCARQAGPPRLLRNRSWLRMLYSSTCFSYSRWEFPKLCRGNNITHESVHDKPTWGEHKLPHLPPTPLSQYGYLLEYFLTLHLMCDSLIKSMHYNKWTLSICLVIGNIFFSVFKECTGFTNIFCTFNQSKKATIILYCLKFTFTHWGIQINYYLYLWKE